MTSSRSLRSAAALALGAALLAAAAPPASRAAEPLPTRKMLPLAAAQEAVAAAVAACAEQGYQVSAAVVDEAGVLRALGRADLAGPHTVDSSTKKAYTALSLRRATAELAKMVAENPAAGGIRDMNERILVLGGGLPIKAGDQVVGGIGVGGAPGGDKDEACAQEGIEAIQARLG